MAFTSNVNQGVPNRFRRWTITFCTARQKAIAEISPVRTLRRSTLPERNWAQLAATIPTRWVQLLISTQKEAE